MATLAGKPNGFGRMNDRAIPCETPQEMVFFRVEAQAMPAESVRPPVVQSNGYNRLNHLPIH